MDREIPKKYKKLYEKGMEGRSRKSSVRSFCLECCGYDTEEVVKCTDKYCPLYPYRLEG